MPLKWLSFKKKMWTCYLTLADDLELGTEEKVLPQGSTLTKYESSITYHPKVMAKFFCSHIEKQTDTSKTICP